MTGDPALDPIHDAELAANLFIQGPLAFGGMVLRGNSPAREALVAAISDQLICRRLPPHIDDERLLGGIDIAASLAAGKPVEASGLLAEAQGGALIVPLAERMGEALAGRLNQALDDKRVALILLDDGGELDETPPLALMERLAFHCDLTHSRERQATLETPQLATPAALDNEALSAIAATGAALGVNSVRALIHTSQTAAAHATLYGRGVAGQGDLEAAARLVLAPRATQLPPPPEEPKASDPPPPEPGDDQQENNQQSTDQKLEDKVVEAATAAIPADLLAQLAKGLAPRQAGASGSGQKRKSGLRGKPLGARPGMPRGGARLAMIDTLRAAVPWQGIRRREVGADKDAPILMRKDDLRVRRFEEKAARVTIFAVDASGSAAAARLAEAKGAVELMLAQAYVTRSEVALIAFRGETAELLLPPTRSLTRARRALAELPGGGGTPLAMGLNAASELARSVRSRGRTPSLIVLTDGRANVDGQGEPGRKQAGEDAEAAAKAIAREGIDALVVDISARASREGGELADAMHARYLALPRADAKTLHAAISTRELA
ncbi:MAG: magnesium chelatase subunit D [Pseudomonadota bacterium]